RALARAGHSGEHRQAALGEFDADVLQVVLARAVHPDQVVAVGGVRLGGPLVLPRAGHVFSVDEAGPPVGPVGARLGRAVRWTVTPRPPAPRRTGVVAAGRDAVGPVGRAVTAPLGPGPCCPRGPAPRSPGYRTAVRSVPGPLRCLRPEVSRRCRRGRGWPG